MVEKLLVILIILLSLQFALNVGPNFDLVITRILVPVLFLAWLVRGLARRRIWIPNKTETWLVLVFLFLLAISLILGKDAGEGVRKFLYFLTIFPVFFVAADVFRDPKWRKVGAIAIIVSGIIASLVALVQFSFPYLLGIGKAVKIWENLSPFFLGNSFGGLVATNSSWLVNIGGKTIMRAFGFFPDPHNFAFFANLCLFVGVGYFFQKKNGASRILIFTGAALIVVSVLLSFSRGAYLGIIAGIVFFAIVFLKRCDALGKATILAGTILVIVFVFSPNIFSQRLSSSFSLKEGSNAERYKNWVEAVDIVQDYPLGGVGLGNYAREVEPTASVRSSIYAHNLLLDIAAETGILNAVIFLFLLLVAVWRNVKNGQALNLGVAAGIVAYLTHSFFDTALYSPQVLTILLIMIALGINNNKLKTQSEKLKATT